jgi:NADPH-ferrihemoprotein reductase
MAIFLMATYGEGEPTDNAVDFYKDISNSESGLGDDALGDLKYTVFGLGNRQYEHYNSMGKETFAKVGALGAKAVYEYGDGDDDDDLEADFEKWTGGLWHALLTEFYPEGLANLENSANDSPEMPKPAFTVSMCGKPAPDAAALKRTGKTDYFKTVPAKVVVNREIRQDTVGGSTRHMEIEIKGTGLTYEMADNLAVMPENNPAIVEGMADRLGLTLDQYFELTSEKGGAHPFPNPCTVRTALSRYLDLSAPPKKPLVKTLAVFAKEDGDRQKLMELGNSKDKYDEHVGNSKLTLLELLAETPSVQLPLEQLIEIVPRLQARYYTISSTPSAHPNRIHATVSIVNDVIKGTERRFLGVCTNHMGRATPLGAHTDDKKARESRPLDQGKKSPRVWPHLDVFVRPSTFKLPADPSVPVIMVGPGTGIAPMRAILQERKNQADAGSTVGDTLLFFGCRRSDEDFIYEDELLGYTQDGTLTNLFTAFSREQSKKVYVQNKLAEEGERVWKLLSLSKPAYIYVCGGTSMGKDVLAAVEKIVQDNGGESQCRLLSCPLLLTMV